MKYNMKAETAKFGKSNYFKLDVSMNNQGQIDVSTDVNGFNPYEIIGLLEIVKQNIQTQIK